MGAFVDALALQVERTDRRLRERCSGIGDREYFWEPVPGCWSVRRREDALGGRPEGRGDWILDNDETEPSPPPFTTIAWRLMHLTDVVGGYHDHLWGDGTRTDNWLEIPGTATEGLALWDHHASAFATALAAEDDESLQRTVRIPWWPQETARWRVVANVIADATHHGAEIGVLRDLYGRRMDWRP